MNNTSNSASTSDELVLRPGQPMPDFALPLVSSAATGTPSSTCGLEDLRGRPFILFIYPKDGTCDCTLVAQQFRDLHARFEELKVRILGLSRDSLGAHKKFIAAQELPFALLSDSSQETMKRWGLIYPSTMYGKPVTKVRRTTVLVDAGGMVHQVWEKVAPEGHAAQVLEACVEMARS